MKIVSITKEFSFEMAHVLHGHDGHCKNIHGHSYLLAVTVKGKPINDAISPKNGMVMDFGDLKKIVQKNIISKFDHTLVLNANSLYKDLLNDNFPSENILLVPYQPTSENLICDFAKKIKRSLPKNVLLHRLILRETPTSFVEWNAEKN